MKPKHDLWSIAEAAELLSLPVLEVHRLINKHELTKSPSVTVESVLRFAARKRIEVKQESES